MVREAFGMSQQTVISESDERQFATYSKSKHVESLEVLARVADLLFRGSEMEDEPLKYKLEHLLAELLRLVHKKIQYNKVIIEEFSDSDDDY